MSIKNIIFMGLLGLACHSEEPAKEPPPPPPAAAPAKVEPKCFTFTDDAPLYASFFTDQNLENFVNEVCVGKLSQEQCADLFVEGFCNLVETQYPLGNTQMAGTAFKLCVQLTQDVTCYKTMEQVMIDTHNESCGKQNAKHQ